VQGLEEKLQLSEDLNCMLRIYREIERLYQELGGTDLPTAVRAKMERIPYPASRFELAACLVMCDMAEHVVAESYLDCCVPEYAAIARSLLDMVRANTSHGEELFMKFCEEPDNLPRVREITNRWLSITIRALGRPGTGGDTRAIELGLRTRTCADSATEFVKRVTVFLTRCGLPFPSVDALGVELP
jgi:1,2-phenylacetyl-CoA epoxidase catalytic subunit